MAKIVVTDLNPPRKRAAKLKSKRVRGEDGVAQTIYTLDSNSPTFNDDFLAVFKRNVAKARREHRQLVRQHRIAAE